MKQFFLSKNITILSALSLLLIVASCNKEDVVAKPVIDLKEVGHDDSKQAYPGADLHIDAEILAEGSIAKIELTIHPENGSGWQFNETFTDGYEGLKNADFHEHIDIAEDAQTGAYHLHLKVTDKEGNVTEAESELEITEDPSLPSIAGFEVEYNATEDEIDIEGDITAPNKIASISLEVHNSSYEKEYDVTGDYAGKTTYHLHQHFSLTDVPAGHYHVHLIITDENGKEREFEEHFDK